MNADELAAATKAFLVAAYPDISVTVLEPSGIDTRRKILFQSARFADLYPLQRYHYIVHCIPAEFFHEHLEDAEWRELAPGEHEQDLIYPDEELVSAITDDVNRCIAGSGFFRRLDERMCPEEADQLPAPCEGDFRVAKAVLAESGFRPGEYFDVFHVLMAQGAYCDCEILYNVAPDNRLKARHWTDRSGHL